jgi:hypothetical protein
MEFAKVLGVEHPGHTADSGRPFAENSQAEPCFSRLWVEIFAGMAEIPTRSDVVCSTRASRSEVRNALSYVRSWWTSGIRTTRRFRFWNRIFHIYSV